MLNPAPIQDAVVKADNFIMTQRWILWCAAIVSELSDGIYRKITLDPSGGVISPTDEVIIFNISIATEAVLPDPTKFTGLTLSITNKYTSTASLTFSEDINGSSTFSITAQQNVTLLCDGTEYLIYE